MTTNQILFFAVSGVLISLLAALIPLIIWWIKVAYGVTKRLSSFDTSIALLEQDNKNHATDINKIFKFCDKVNAKFSIGGYD